MDRKRLISINGIDYVLHVTSPTRGVLCRYEPDGSRSEGRRLLQVVEIPLNQHQLRSLYGDKTAAEIVRLARRIR
jgi:hypothetical protein